MGGGELKIENSQFKIRSAGVDVIQLPQAEPDVAFVAFEERSETWFQRGRTERLEIGDKLSEEGTVDSTLDEGRQHAATMQGHDQKSGFPGREDQPPQSNSAELFGSVKEHRMAGRERFWKLSSR
jgi:hypothetical protein